MTRATEIQLSVVLPTCVLLTESAVEVHLNTVAGSHGILPRHADFATALVSGIFEYRTPGGEVHYVAADSGAAVKQGNELVVATPYGATSTNLHELELGVRDHFASTDARERQMLAAMQRLEATLTRGVWELARKERSA
jgi:F-type H+-transporting ATPase subunit epsilon